jgi:hypothetical protein
MAAPGGANSAEGSASRRDGLKVACFSPERGVRVSF